MCSVNNQKGISLIEILCACALLAVVGTSLTSVLPKMTANALSNHQHVIATNLAAAKIETLSAGVYLYTPTTDVSLGVFNTNCDCRTGDWTVMPFTQTVVGAVTYTTSYCIHQVQSASTPQWQSQCAGAAPDTGYKNIVVRVAWTKGTQAYSVLQEATVTRY